MMSCAVRQLDIVLGSKGECVTLSLLYNIMLYNPGN